MTESKQLQVRDQQEVASPVEQARIEVKLEDGVLRLALPKAEKAVPRQITEAEG